MEVDGKDWGVGSSLVHANAYDQTICISVRPNLKGMRSGLQSKSDRMREGRRVSANKVSQITG